MTPQEIADVFQTQFGSAITGTTIDAPCPAIIVAVDRLEEVCRFARDDSRLAFDYLKDLTVVDWLITDEKRAQKLGVEPVLELVYQLFSFRHRHDFTIKARLPRWKDGQVGELPEAPTVSHLWKIADWHEREAFDLFGIEFVNHPNLRRILCAEDWVGYPLRKDYEFPLEYHGIRCR